MVIEVKEKGTRAYYRDFLGILQQYPRLMKKPTAKMHRLPAYYIVSTVIIALALCVAVWSSAVQPGWRVVWAVCSFILVLGIALEITNIVRMSKAVKGFMKNSGYARVVIDAEGVALERADEAVRLAWDSVLCVLQGRSVITFLPGDRSGILIGLPVEYADKVRAALDEAGQGSREITPARYYLV